MTRIVKRDARLEAGPWWRRHLGGLDGFGGLLAANATRPPVMPVQGQSSVALAKGGGGPDTAHMLLGCSGSNSLVAWSTQPGRGGKLLVGATRPMNLLLLVVCT